MDDAHEIAVDHTIQVFLLAHEFLIDDVLHRQRLLQDIVIGGSVAKHGYCASIYNGHGQTKALLLDIMLMFVQGSLVLIIIMVSECKAFLLGFT